MLSSAACSSAYPTCLSRASFAIAMSSVTLPCCSHTSSASRTSEPRRISTVGNGERSAKSAGSSSTSPNCEFGWNVSSLLLERGCWSESVAWKWLSSGVEETLER
eukprot:711787-Rhodomonas_salina.5